MLRCADQNQNLSAKQRRHDRKRNGNPRRERHCIYDIPAHQGILLCTKGLRDRDRKPAAQSYAKANDQKIQRAARSHRCQRIDSKRLSYDNRIRQIVKLLE